MSTAQRMTARVDYVDAVRVLLIMLVVAHHSVEPYTVANPPELPLPDPPMPRVSVFLWVNANFFMGFFFFLAGYYTKSAYDRRGGGRFLGDRALRLGVPLVLGTLLFVSTTTWVHSVFDPAVPPVDWWTSLTRDFLGIGAKPAYWPATRRWPEFNFGHLWFIEHLLIWAVLYAAWRRFAPPPGGILRHNDPPSHLELVGYAILLALVTFGIRIGFPINRWIGFLGFIQMEPAHIAQYASLFVIGVYAGPRRWIETMPTRRGLLWLAIGGGLAILAYILAAASPTPGGDPNSIVASFEEAFMCVGLVVGITVAFRELGLGAGRLWRLLARNVYAIYVCHYPIVILVQWLLVGTEWPKWLRLIVTAPIAAVLTVLFTHFVVLRLPGLRRVF
jgi:peptidoglycan/LPS O-acetylase OafA/YrhL